MNKKRLSVLFVLTLAALPTFGQNQVVYSTISSPLPGNVVSQGFECCAVQEFGDGLGLVNSAGGQLQQVTVVLSSWACESGSWNVGNCVSSPNARFSQALTVNVWSVNDTTSPASAGVLLGSVTDTFKIPFRPSSTPSKCGGNTTRWYSPIDNSCYRGLATPISLNFSNEHVTIPANNKIIVTVAYNTSDFGPSPLGHTAPCNSPTYNNGAGCPYDSLNVSADTTNGTFNLVGSPVDTNGVFVRPASLPYPYSSCGGPMTPGVLADDTGCWAGYHPQIEVRVNTNAKPNQKGNGK